MFLSKTKNKTKNYLAHIDGLRALAVITIFFHHLNIKYFSGGFVGVDVFFVISGYLITKLIKIEIDTYASFSFRNFYARRVKRLLPAFMFVSILTLTGCALIFSPTHFEMFGESLFFSILSVSNIYFWLNADYFDISSQLKPFLHTWSLGVEEQFYMVWPLLLLLSYSKLNKYFFYVFLIVLITLSVYLNFMFSDGGEFFSSDINEYFSDGKSTIFYLFPFRSYEFIIGAIVVFCEKNITKKVVVNDFFFLIGFFVLIYVIYTFDEKMLYPMYAGFLPCIATALLIISGRYTRFYNILTNSPMIFIGLLSYSIYLIHWPIIVLWKYLTTSFSNIDKMIIVTITLLISTFSYCFVENKFRYNYFFTLTKKYTFVVLVICITIISAHISLNNGWLWRLNDENKIMVKYSGTPSEFHREFYGGTGYSGYITGNKNSPLDIILIGDSHGRHYADGLYNKIVLPNTLNFYVSPCASCIHLPGFTRLTKGINWDKVCTESLQKELEVISRAKNNSIVVLSQSWVSQMLRSDMLDSNGRKLDKKITVYDIINGINHLSGLIGSSKLVVIGNVPTTNGMNVYDLLTRPNPLIFGHGYNLSSLLKSKIKTEVKEFNSKLKEASLKNNKFIFLDPFDVLCNKGYCKNFDSEKNMIYSDKSHLSIYGSNYIIDAFSNQLKSLIVNKNISKVE
ncbi:acyltransferase family protein [Zooshikella ganghwensis]|uniref:Acyltransferase n=1 Tax=Zooshikella ganghwensis TaxID=202772 RepID=A0A4P9VM77_9GAMM|nr:acyltransferase family protein [Zooshikella ganghwensis]RDH43210.1 acyltransferase [Zooshikella ganghwensis]